MIRYLLFVIMVITVIAFLSVNTKAESDADYNMDYLSGNSGLVGTVVDQQNGERLPARLVLTNADGQYIESYYNKYPGHFTGEDGSFNFNLLPGDYTLQVYHGIDYLSQTLAVHVKKDYKLKISIQLQPWLPLRSMGWVNGDGHAHLYTDKKHNDEMLTTVRRICRAQGVDFISANQGWAGYTDSDWRYGYARFSDERFLLYYGAEMPKYRTGHTWWLGLESCRDYFGATMDTCYENLYYQDLTRTHWDFNSLPMLNIPDVELVARFKNAENAVACIPHPTSWWWQKRGDIIKYTTNVCSYLSFGLLAGSIWDGLVVMGYEKDHYYYQNLWFNILNLGYRMTPLAELDGGYGPDNKFAYGSMRVYYQVGDSLNMDRIVTAVRNGRTFVTSGPVVLTSIDNTFQVGDELTADGAEHTLHIEAYASGEAKDYLTYLVVFRNGQIYKLWDLRDSKPRHFVIDQPIKETGQAWYVVKAYGKNTWSDPALLDVMAVCRKIEEGTLNADINEHDVCITSPYYFRPPDESPPAALESQVNINLVHPETGQVISKADIDILLSGKVINSIAVTKGNVQFTMPCNAILKISVPDLKPIYRCLYLDYPPQQKLIETLANGDWLEQNNRRNTMQPGQVPWKAFQYAKTREILEKVNWMIIVQPNERDGLWNDFEALF